VLSCYIHTYIVQYSAVSSKFVPVWLYETCLYTYSFFCGSVKCNVIWSKLPSIRLVFTAW